MQRNPTSAERIGALLIRERGLANLSQRALAERIGVDQASIARWESGRREATLAQIDSVLACYGVRLSFALEPRPDPALLWAAEAVRLAGLTPAERLEECSVDLLGLVQGVRRSGTDLVVDGNLAAWLLGVPEPPRRLAVVLTHSRLREWMPLFRMFGGVVSEDDVSLAGRDADYIIEHEQVLLRSCFGTIELRVVPDGELPPRRRITIAEGVDVDVVMGVDVVTGSDASGPGALSSGG